MCQRTRSHKAGQTRVPTNAPCRRRDGAWRVPCPCTCGDRRWMRPASSTRKSVAGPVGRHRFAGGRAGESGWGESQRQEVANRTPAPAPGLWRQSHWIAAMGQYAYQKRAGGRPVKRAMTPGPAPHQDPATDLAKSTADRLQRPGGTGITCECVRDVCTTATRSTVRARYQVEGKGKRKGPRSPRFS